MHVDNYFCAVSPLLLFYRAALVTPILLLYRTEPCPSCDHMQRGGLPAVPYSGPVPRAQRRETAPDLILFLEVTMKHNTRRAPFARREMAELEELFVKEFYEGFGERNAGELS